MAVTGAVSSRPEETVAQYMQKRPSRMPDRHDGKQVLSLLSTLASTHHGIFGS